MNLIFIPFLRYFSLEFIYNDPAAMFNATFKMNLGFGILSWMVVSAIGYLILNPFDKVLKAIESTKRFATKEEIRICLDSYKKSCYVVLVANFIGFFVGQAIFIAEGILSGRTEFVASRVFFIMAQAISFGLISATSTLKAFDFFISKHREKLYITSVSEFKKEKSLDISTWLYISFFTTAIFFGINHLSVAYGILYGVVRNTFSGDLTFEFIRKGAICFVFSTILCSFSIISIVKALSGRIKLSSKLLADIAHNGDLRTKLRIAMADDFGTLTSSTNTLIDKLSKMITDLRNETFTVDKSAQLVSDSSQTASAALLQMLGLLSDVNKNTHKQNELIYQADESISVLTASIANIIDHVDAQASNMENISSAITQMTGNITNVTHIVKNAQIVSEKLSDHSSSGNEFVVNAINSMKEVQSVSEEVRTLSKIIQDISSRTNLLAMNAAIEAAHAGEVGEGFAVVADEVRALAASSSNGAKNVQSKIKEMLEKINTGVEAITNAGDAFNKISDDISVNASIVKNISDAMEEQRIGANNTLANSIEIVNSVHAIRNLTQKETENVDEVRNFMETVIEAATSTQEVVTQGIEATKNLQNTIDEVRDSANGNKNVVQNISKHVQSFKV